MRKRECRIIAVVMFAGFILIAILDYADIPSALGLSISNMNWNIYMGFVNIIVVVFLYLITYKLINERTIEKENNQKEVANFLIKETYQSCINYMELLSEEVVEKYIVPKISFDAKQSDNIILVNLKGAPFSAEETILSMMKDGQFEGEQVKKYFCIKGKYQEYINARITFYDAPEIYKKLYVCLKEIVQIEIEQMEE